MVWTRTGRCMRFPFLFGGTFIEGATVEAAGDGAILDFPSFSEGLSLRALRTERFRHKRAHISLPFRRDFH